MLGTSFFPLSKDISLAAVGAGGSESASLPLKDYVGSMKKEWSSLSNVEVSSQIEPKNVTESEPAPLAGLVDSMLQTGRDLKILNDTAKILEIGDQIIPSKGRGFERKIDGKRFLSGIFVAQIQKENNPKTIVLISTKIDNLLTYYLTSPSGRLEKAAKEFVGSPVFEISLDEAQKGFETEKAYWLKKYDGNLNSVSASR